MLSDDNFATIINAVEEAERYMPISKAIQILLSTNIAEVLCLFIVTMIMPAGTVFMTPVMILWVNLVTDSLPALALGMEKAEPDIMDYPPRKQGASLFSGITEGISLFKVHADFACVERIFYSTRYLAISIWVSVNHGFCIALHDRAVPFYNYRSQEKSVFSKTPSQTSILTWRLLWEQRFIHGFDTAFMQTAFKNNAHTLADCNKRRIAIMIIPLVEAQKQFK